MAGNSIVSKVEEKTRRKSILEEIIWFGQRNRQLGLFLFIYWYYSQFKEGVSISRLYRFYNNIATHIVHENTVRKQLKLLENKGLIEIKETKVYPRVFDLEATAEVFDFKRSRAGQRGAKRILRKLLAKRSKELDTDIPKNLDYCIKKIVEKATYLARKGRRDEALDLLVHTLLPIRKSGVLWVWKRDEFIYYEKKILNRGAFHSIRFPALAEALRRLGFEEGIMVNHLLGHKYAGKLIEKLFSKGHLSWPWARSVFYGLKKLGLAFEGNNYIIELKYENSVLIIWLKDLYGNPLYVFEMEWNREPPQPLSKNRSYFKIVVIGKQHIKEENEEGYFDRW